MPQARFQICRVKLVYPRKAIKICESFYRSDLSSHILLASDLYPFKICWDLGVRLLKHLSNLILILFFAKTVLTKNSNFSSVMLSWEAKLLNVFTVVYKVQFFSLMSFLWTIKEQCWKFCKEKPKVSEATKIRFFLLQRNEAYGTVG